MAGVSLVGFSGSLIKDTLHPIASSLANFLDPTTAANEPIDQPEATKVVIGILLERLCLSPIKLPCFHRYLFHTICSNLVSQII